MIREWDASAVAHAGVFGPVPGGDQAWSAQQIATLATVTAYNPVDIKTADGTVLAPAGSRVIETLGPARPSVVPGVGVTEGVRPREVTTYDQGAPNGGLNTTSGTGYNLPTTTRTTAAGSTGVDLPGPVVLTETTLSYAPVVSGDASGWTLGLPTKTTTGGISSVTRYDSEGRVIETRQPSEATTGTGLGTRKSAYYTAGANSVDAACGNRPEWAGMACRTWPAATVSTGLPDERTSGYSMWLSPTTVVETSAGATRTTTSTYDTAGRVTTEATTLTGVAGSTPVPTTQTVYSATTGEVTSAKSVNSSGVVTATESFGYDSFGRPTVYTNELGDTTTTTYTAAGQVATVTDPKGVTSYVYDGTDAAGLTERRGLPTKVSTTFGGRTHVMTAGYDTNGTMTRQDMPGGITQTIATDAAGEPEEMFYSGPVTDPDTGTTSTGPWLGWHLLNDPLGRVATESTPAGAVFDGSDTGGNGTGGVGDGYGYERSYTYDGASRLTGVVDRTATGYTGSVLDPDTPAPSTCQKRDYAFDVNSNRTGLTTAECDGTGATAKTWAYNAGDAATTGANGQGAYVYDAFGRQTTIPAADTPYGSANLSLGYYDTDAPKSVAGPGVTTSFTLDVQGRRLTQTSAGQGRALPPVRGHGV